MKTLKLILISCLLFLSFQSKAQTNTIQVIPVISPPFPPQFSYYINNPNQMSVTLVNTSSQQKEVYLSAKFAGDNGIEIKTEDGYKPLSSIILKPNIPYYLTRANVEDVFSVNNLEYSGITKEELEQTQALPEGNYQICFNVYDYNTNEQLSADEPAGCSNTIIIQYVDPPQILNPQCDDTLISSNPQNILFSWTPAIGANPNIKYKFTLIEMFPGDENNPEDLFSSGINPFYETETSVNQLLLGASEPPLTEGRSYAFRVQAFDPLSQVSFKNNGYSEICTFTYKKSRTQIIADDLPDVNIDDFINNFNFIPVTKISGQLRYKLASDADLNNSSGAAAYYSENTENNTNSYQNNVNASISTGNLNINKLSLGNFNIQNNIPPGFSFKPPFGKGTINEISVNTGNAEPLRNTLIRLVVRMSYKNDDGFFRTKEINDINDYTFFDINGNQIDINKILSTVNKVVDVSYTDETGNFSFDFQTDFFTGTFYAHSENPANFPNQNYTGIISLKIEVLNKKFCSPDIDIFAKPGDILNTPAQIALIKDYDLHIKVISAYDYYSGNTEDETIHLGQDNKPKAIPGGQAIPGATVKVLRDLQKVKNEHPAILLAEGQQLGSTTTNLNGTFKNVFIGKTDKNGEITIPHLVEHWAITDGEDSSPYFFSITTRAEQTDTSGNQYENTLYNYLPFFGTITGLRISVESGATELLDDDAAFSGNAPVVYNHFYSPPQSANNREVDLNAAKPEIKGRIMSKSNLENIGLSDVNVNLINQPDIGPDKSTILLHGDNPNLLNNMPRYTWEQKGFTNKSGFFRFEKLRVYAGQYNEARGPYRRFQINHPMYKRITWPPLKEKALNMKYGELFFKEFQLEPKFLLKAKVVDETGHPVSAYLRVLPNNPFIKTEPRYEYDDNGNIYVEGEFLELPVAETGNKIEIQPLSNQYFADTVLVNQLPQNPNSRVVFTVSKKLHRLHLVVENKQTNKGIANAEIIVGDSLAYGKTDENGVAELKFPSPGQQFLIKVNAESYSPAQISYNIPVSNTMQNKILFIEPAYSIEGIITDKTSNSPISKAKIFSRLQSSDGQTVYIETFSDDNGKYVLQGIPMNLTKIDIHVVKDGKNPSYVGTKKTVSINPFAYPKPSYNFKLRPVKTDLTEIWGLPVSVETMTIRQGKVSISGFFHDLPTVPGFSTLNSDEKIYFKNLKINPNANKVIPLKNTITTENFNILVKIKGGFTGKFKIPSPALYPQKLIINKTGEYGKISAALKLDLSSLKFAYDFSGDFYLGNDTLHNDITLIKATNGNSQFFFGKKYIFDLNENYKPEAVSNFKVFGFNASSNFKMSYYLNDKIFIGTILHTDIPMPNNNNLDLKINAGKIEVTKDNIEMKHNFGNKISLNLEKWKIESKSGWYFDKTKDAIIIPEALILTGLGIDASIKGLNIRPNALREGKINIKKGLTLGGIATLTIAKGLKPVFNYDAGVGHYRISLVGSSQGPAAWVNNLPATNEKLEFTSVGMLSDNTSVLSLGKHMIFYNLLDIFVDQIMTGNGFFSLAGMPEIGIPGFVPTRAIITYTKQGNRLKAKLEPLSGAVDCNANIVYTLNTEKTAQTLTNKKYTSYGTFHIKPAEGESGEELTIKGFLTKTPNECYIDAITPQTVKMGKEKMKLVDGKITVSNNRWGELSFNCNTNSTGLENDNLIAYTVHGGIEADGSGIKVNQIKTPLGDLNMAYLFNEKALVGDLTIKTGLNMGFAGIKSGMMATRFDPAGFYLMFSGAITMASDTYEGGFILGNYNSDLTEKTKLILKNFETKKPDMTSLHGFYAIGQRNLIDIGFPIPPLWVTAKAGLGAYVSLDYYNPKFIIGGYAFAKAEGGMDLPLCGYVGAKANAVFDIEGGYKNNALFIQSCGELTVSVGACNINTSVTLLNKNKLSSDGNNEITFKVGGSCK